MPIPRREDNSALTLYRRLLGYAGNYWSGFTLAVLGMVFYAATDTGFVALLKPMLDGSFVNKDPQIIRLVPILLLAIAFVRGIAGFLSNYGMAWVGRHVIRDLRAQMFDQLLTLPTRYYDTTPSGQMLSKFTYDVEQVAQAATNAVTIIIRDTFTIIGLLAWMLYLNAALTLIFLLIGPLVAILVRYVNKRFRRISTRIQDSIADVTHVAEEVIEGHKVVKTFHGQQVETDRFHRANEANRRQFMKYMATSAASVPIVQFIAACALAAIIFMVTRNSVLDPISVGTFMSFVAAMMMLLAPLKRLTNVNSSVQRGIAAADSIFKLLDQQKENDSGTRSIGRARGDLVYHDVSLSYDPDKGLVLNRISFMAEAGQTVALVGRSGSGKTSLVNLLTRFYEPSDGYITLDGTDIRELRLDDLRNQIALVGQQVTLFNDTIRNNIAYGALRHSTSDEVYRAAEAAHAMEFIAKLPQGFDTLVGENGVLLSGGQRQRLAIARALLKNTPILILDEATSSLDSESELYIQDALGRLMHNRTTMVIAHRLSTIENADRILVLEKGVIVESGSHNELLDKGGRYASLYRLQFHEPAELQSIAAAPPR